MDGIDRHRYVRGVRIRTKIRLELYMYRFSLYSLESTGSMRLIMATCTFLLELE